MINPRFLLAVLCAAALVNGRDAQAAEFCVSTAAALQNALFTAAANGQDDVIKVQAGTYLPTSAIVYAPSAAQALTISGGWDAGCAMQASDPSLTTLSGNNQRRVFGMNSAHPASISLSNMTIANGFGSSVAGAGVYVQSEGDVFFTDLIFRANIVQGDVSLHRGGAVFIEKANVLQVLRTLFEDNHAPRLGAMVARVCSGVAINESRFERNSVGGLEVGPLPICERTNISVAIEASQFVDQSGQPIGVISEGGDIDLVNVEVQGTVNSGATGGLACGRLRTTLYNYISEGLPVSEPGRIRIDAGTYRGLSAPEVSCFSVTADLSLSTATSSLVSVKGATFADFAHGVFPQVFAEECLFEGNVFESNGGRAAIDSWCVSLDARRNRFIGNESGLGSPGAILAERFFRDLVLESNLFLANSTSDLSRNGGGAVRIELACPEGEGCQSSPSPDAGVQFTNNTFLSNSSLGDGGAVTIRSAFDTSPSIGFHNNLFWGNLAGGFGNDVFFDNDRDGNFITTPATFENNAIGLSTGGYVTTVAAPPPAVPPNFDAEPPLFVDPETGDYRLSALSPYRDVGENLAPELGALDLDGAPRISGAAVDIGALEVDGAVDPIDTLPDAVDDEVGPIKEGTTWNGSVATNDLPGDGQNTWSLTQQATLGVAQVQADGSASYTANQGVFGTDVFSYSLCDEDGDCDTAQVTVNVILNIPQPQDDLIVMSYGTSFSGSVATNDHLAQGPHAFALSGTFSPVVPGMSVSMSTAGVLQVTTDPQVLPAFIGDTVGQYLVCDIEGDCAFANITVRLEDPSLAGSIFADGFERQ